MERGGTSFVCSASETDAFSGPELDTFEAPMDIDALDSDPLGVTSSATSTLATTSQARLLPEEDSMRGGRSLPASNSTNWPHGSPQQVASLAYEGKGLTHRTTSRKSGKRMGSLVSDIDTFG